MLLRLVNAPSLFAGSAFALLARVDFKASPDKDYLVVLWLRSLTFQVSISATLAAFGIFLSVSVDIAFYAR